MAKLRLTAKENTVFQALGAEAYVRARVVADRGAMVDVAWREREGCAVASVAGDAPVAVKAVWRPETNTIEGVCTCRRSGSCDHRAALVLLTINKQPIRVGDVAAAPRQRLAATSAPYTTAPAARAPEPFAWERTIDAWFDTPHGRPVEAEGPVGLSFEVVAGASTRVVLRLVVPGKSGWVRSSSVSWSSLRWGVSLLGAGRRRLLSEMLSLATGGDVVTFAPAHNGIELTAVRSRRIWDVLAEADEVGLPMVRHNRAAGAVVVSREPARMTVRATRAEGDIVMIPALTAGSAVIPKDAHALVGSPPHGVVWWGTSDEAPGWVGAGALRLAPLARDTDTSLFAAMTAAPVRVPATHEARFLQHVYPRMCARVQIVVDDTIQLPEVGRSRLVLRVRTLGELAGAGIALDWSWVVPIGDTQREESLWPEVLGSIAGAPSGVVDADRRADLASQVLELVVKRAPSMGEDVPSGHRLASAATIEGDQLIRFLSEVLPALREMDDVDVHAPVEVLDLDCWETQERPTIRFASGKVDERDWYDLSVQVAVAGEQVVFHELFVALAQEREFLLLPSGTYFSLDQPEFRQLRDLIAEARELEDAPPGVLRIGRYQASLWAELSELGEVTGVAGAWQQSLRELFEHPGQVELPAGLRAQLRSYQRDGLTWLAARYDHDIGGILADDMGLGKTMQTLALVCHARDHWDVGPFLVVAPASVVSNWVTEAHRFTPDLDVRTVTQTESRRGLPLAQAVAGSDIVITSYTLFRLEYADYEAISWGGLVLDEAQFVKNPYGKGFDCAMRLPTPFKLAITGTPMENNLAELWSLCTITAPGILPRISRFTEYYRNPIERDHDPERLDQLRRRIRPFLLRRRKSDVAIDLPSKQEQVVELELAPQHRRAYQTYLQRERQKVLGLLGDLEKNRFQIFRSLTLLRQAALDVALVGHKSAVPSTKLDHLVEQVAEIAAEGHRTLVFSQFTRFLTAARERLERAGIGCVYLDGKTTNRAAIIDDFKHGAAPVFLISLKSGGFGLNLTEADYCILLDPWWNPASEAQAVDRVHRIGQTRNVMVYRLLAKNTIEEKVMALKARKAELFRGVLDEGGFADAQLTVADIRALLD